MKKDVVKKYDHHDVELKRYDWWVENKYFEADVNSPKLGFSLILPPPNVTGKLHLGHAWDGSLQDTIIRYKKLLGFETLYLPAMDHAGIATQTKVEAKLKEQGIDRYELGREKFLEATWSWKAEYAQTIREQWKKLGLSLDYSKEKFTLDFDVNQLVNEVFVDFYNKGLIYKGKQIVNWDPVQKTAISNVEVVYEETEGNLYYFKYFFPDHQDYLVVATTRPETMFGDVAVVVNPNDERYQKYFTGDKLQLKVINPANNELVLLLTDEYVDPDYGTGVMKVTPAHDSNDFEIGVRHQLEKPVAFNPDGTINELGGVDYEGLDRFEARQKLVEASQKNGTLVKVEPITHQVGFSERTGAIVEPYLSDQWFVKMEPLAKKVLELQASEEAINFFPPRFNDVLKSWMDNAHDWTISRQLWWGHQIPAWYRIDSDEVYVGVEPPKDVEHWVQDDDVLDTWFSSGLWPLATLNWTKDQPANPLFEKFYPTSVLVTGYDIIFFWVARMIFMALEEVDQKPFNDVLLHGLTRDEQGRKMSKSLGNGIDPMDVIEQYGADALRFFLLTNSTPGQDLKYSENKIRDAWNFINKLWNASRFVFLNLDDDFQPWPDFANRVQKNADEVSDVNKWILTGLSEVQATVLELIDKYEFGIIGRELYNFVWSDFCSWFIELSKVELASTDKTVKEWSQQTLFYVLKEILILLHPLIPFVTEDIYQELDLKKSILEESLVHQEFNFQIKYLTIIMTIIGELREFKLKKKIPKDKFLELNLTNVDNYLKNDFITYTKNINDLLKKFVNSEVYSINKIEFNKSRDSFSIPVENFFVEINNYNFFDKKNELENLKNKLNELQLELERSQKMLANQNFLAKADPEKVQLEKTKQEQYQQQYDLIKQKIAELEKTEK